MQIESVRCRKILLFWFFLMFLCEISHGEDDLRILNAKALYKKVLQKRSLSFEDCGSTYEILNLSISTCNNIPCEMPRGSKASVRVVFDGNGNNVSFLRQHVVWILNAIQTTATITPDPCEGIHYCLLNHSAGQSYNTTVIVKDSLPSIRGTMLWRSLDQNGAEVMCFRIPIVIVQ